MTRYLHSVPDEIDFNPDPIGIGQHVVWCERSNIIAGMYNFNIIYRVKNIFPPSTQFYKEILCVDGKGGEFLFLEKDLIPVKIDRALLKKLLKQFRSEEPVVYQVYIGER